MSKILDTIAAGFDVCNPDTNPNNWSVRFWRRFWLWRNLDCECCKFYRAMSVSFCVPAAILASVLGSWWGSVILAGCAGSVILTAAYESYTAKSGDAK